MILAWRPSRVRLNSLRLLTDKNEKENYIKPSAKANTVACYESMIENHIIPHLGELELDQVKPMAIQTFVTKLLAHGNEKTGKGLSANTVNLLITLVQSSLEVVSSVG